MLISQIDSFKKILDFKDNLNYLFIFTNNLYEII
jgi:hypothetical protein